MKNQIIISIVISVLLFACKNESSEDSTPVPLNLINNSSFETSANQPDYSGWMGTAFLTDSLGNHNIPLVQDAPANGGQWCVQLEPMWYPAEGYTETILTGQAGTHIYQVTAWMKTISWTGSISLEQYSNGQLIDHKQLTDSSGVWKLESLVDTLTVLASDTLKVHLSAGSTELANGKVRFDMVQLKNLN